MGQIYQSAMANLGDREAGYDTKIEDVVMASKRRLERDMPEGTFPLGSHSLLTEDCFQPRGC